MTKILPPLHIQNGFAQINFVPIILWLCAMISIPILRWTIGDGALPWAASLGVTLQAWAVLSACLQQWGFQRLLRITLLVLPLSWLIEYIGSTTGWPFGAYHYTELLIPQFRGVPLLIPLAWLMMLPPSWAIAACISRSTTSATFVLLSAAAMTAWDLFLDPQMVQWGFWIWAAESLGANTYFGIPWLNFFGWFISAALLTWLATLVVDLNPLPLKPLLLIYVLTWLLEVGGLAFFWGLPGPAICGFIAMGGLILWAAIRVPTLPRELLALFRRRSPSLKTRPS